MLHVKRRTPSVARFWPRLGAAVVLSLLACGRSSDFPSPPHRPMQPQTLARKIVSSGIRNALYTYVGKSDSPRPANMLPAHHRVVLTT